ncbi:alpha/beta hydrolase [Prauserella endophytica]|uniref:Alpha/beta hydrolase n=1 Tax=Prauserella endophytica TaxID=1592324 RepID=A0ABY2S0K3_9PSEU|nr:alpha/beta hydrolase [Prauserella endophytica]
MAGTLAVTLSAVLVAPPANAAPQQVHLPQPEGPHAPGTSLLHLVDEGRIDGLDPEGGPRELMAQVWYPALPLPWYERADYASPKEAARQEEFYVLPDGALEGAVTNSRRDAPALPGNHPVVIFYHGLCASRTDTTAVNERLASLGFVVVALGSTHESDLVEFPGGRTVSTADPTFCAAASDFSTENQAILNRLQEARVADVRFVLDGLEAGTLPLPSGVARSADVDRAGIYGHSFGGSTAAQAMLEDPRLRAGVNLDGLVVGPVRTEGLDKPFLVLGSDYHDDKADPTWADFLPALTGWHQWLRVRDAGHYRFVDQGGSADRWNMREVMPPEVWTANFDDIGDEPSQRILLDYTSAFFLRFLKGEEQPILDGPSARYPEVEFRTAAGEGPPPGR